MTRRQRSRPTARHVRGRRAWRPGHPVRVVVALRADTFGQMNGQLVVGYNQSGSPATIPIDATGGGTPQLKTPTRRLDSAPQPIDGRPTRRLITLISNGTAAAWLDTYTIQGADARRLSNRRSPLQLPIARRDPTRHHLRLANHLQPPPRWAHGQQPPSSQPARSHTGNRPSPTLQVKLEGRGHAHRKTPSR